MKQENIRNVAMIAHVSHSKTTVVSPAYYGPRRVSANRGASPDTYWARNGRERERGITILSKNISIHYKGYVKINVIDTPGHADFGGEVERVLNMADGASAHR